MSQPIQPQPYGQQPPSMRPQADPDLPNPGRWEKRQQKQKRFGWVALVVTALVSLTLGGLVGGANDAPTTAQPQPTATTAAGTETADPPVGEGEGTEAPEPEPDPTTKAPAKFDPKPSDFEVTLKITGKQCFGSAGCSVSFEPNLSYIRSADELPDEGVTSVTYEVTGTEDAFIGTLEVDGEGKVTGVDEQHVDTTSSSKKLVAKVTAVDYNEFG